MSPYVVLFCRMSLYCVSFCWVSLCLETCDVSFCVMWICYMSFYWVSFRWVLFYWVAPYWVLLSWISLWWVSLLGVSFLWVCFSVAFCNMLFCDMTSTVYLYWQTFILLKLDYAQFPSVKCHSTKCWSSERHSVSCHFAKVLSCWMPLNKFESTKHCTA